jgi:hypothetical protein
MTDSVSREGAKSAKSDLKRAISLVDRLALAPLVRVRNARPKDWRSDRYSRWQRRLREVESEAGARLEAEGARFRLDSDATRIRFCGVSASSTMGLEQALRNWTEGARKRLAKGVLP